MEDKQQKIIRMPQKEEYSLLGESWEENTEDEEQQEINIQRLKEYTYYNGDAVFNSGDFPKTSLEAGRKLYEKDQVRVDRIGDGFLSGSSEKCGQIEATVKGKREEYNVSIIFDRNEILYAQCECPECRRYVWGWGGHNSKCRYTVATALWLRDYLNKNNFTDATDWNGENFLKAYSIKNAENSITAAEKTQEKSLTLIPRLIRKNGKLYVSFKVGTGKLFVVKDLREFSHNVRDGLVAKYGSATEFNHKIENFTEESHKWIHYIERAVSEEEHLLNKIEESGMYIPGKMSIGSDLELFGWRIDTFYELLGKETVEYEDRDGTKKTKKMIHCAEANPRASMQIEEYKKGEKDFHGVMVKGKLPILYHGLNNGYFVQDDSLCKTESDFPEKIRSLEKMSRNGNFYFKIGRNALSGFYHNVFPKLQEIADITESDPTKFRQYLSPQVYFTFYLDAPGNDVTCRIMARYGSKEYSVTERVFLPSLNSDEEKFRDMQMEEAVLYQTLTWFGEYAHKADALTCEEDEDKIYRLMESGIDELLKLGEVQCTERFRGRHVIRKVKVSVGVSVSGNLLDLNISTEDIDQKELLDILRSYREKKKYYRLKSGEFVSLKGQELGMLSELMDTLHLPPKEFIKGKMHIPAYRTLYLDRLLEANESVYSKRDRHFRDIVKGFKTIKDADFEEPETLSEVMRNYQKDGFRWMRTLEMWKFGGILADDMGLGKTLQMIAVILSAKTEGKAGTSLVVAPAALVYNWGEELARFAPELKVALISGNQNERRQKLEDWQDADVLVTSYDLLKRDIDQYEDKEFLYEVIDEAQYIKNHNTAAAKAVKVIHSQTRFALTGTPIENRLSELWSIFDYLMPGFLYGYDTFRKEIEIPIVKNKDQVTMERLQRMTGPFILRRLKEEVLKDLPEKLEEIRYVKFDEKQQKLYDAQVVHMKNTLAGQDEGEFARNKLRILAELTRLRQICCSPSLCFEDYKGESAKTDACLQLIQSAIDGGHRMLLFSQFTSMLDILKTRLEEEKIPYYEITGETSKEKRQQLVKDFNAGDVPVFLISLKAGGVGLNLTGADVVIHYDPWWNQAVQNQATDRAHRIGQTKKVTVYKLIAKGSIEEKIQKLQETKKDLAEQIIGGESVQLGNMSREDMMELLEIQ